ncbi:hypothetical protein GCM10010104_24680 [Streptomyces indiaensis]|uniref:Uncharacterized protein n=1 Tax=Streptomyces indiaensis TaxID=284033 RepID=A0ABP5QDL7_9ACTN
MGVTATTVRAVNGWTARWAGASEDGTVFSATGVWPLLAHLGDRAGARRGPSWRRLSGSPPGKRRMPHAN